MATKQQLTDLALEALADGSFHIASKLAAMARDADVKPAVKPIPKPAQLELQRPMATVDDVRKTIDNYLRRHDVGAVVKYVDIASYVQGVLCDSLDFSMTNETSPRPRLKWRRQITHYIAVLRDSCVLDIMVKRGQRYVIRRHP